MLLWSLAAIATGCASQAPAARMQLPEGDPAARADAVAALADRGAGPLLHEELRRLRAAPADAENDLLLFYVLDALIRLGHEVDPRDLLPLIRGERRLEHAAAAFVLLAQHPRPEPLAAVMDQFDGHRAEWLAAGNLLVRVGPHLLAPRALAPLRPSLVVTVVDERTHGRKGLGGGGFIAFACDEVVVPAGFPPLPIYELVQEDDPGSVLLAPGVHPVRYVRSFATGKRSTGASFGGSSRDDMRLGWLAAMLGATPEALQLDLSATATVTWHGAEALQRDVARLRAQAERPWRRLVESLAARGWLAGTEVPTVHVSCADRRYDQSEPLPAVAPAR